jgi:cation diffusion facilitator family transporter
MNFKRINPEKITRIGLGVNVLLLVIKLFVGFASGSRALIADGIHTASDFAGDLAVLWSIKASAQPADSDHHYGHRRYQSLVALFISILIFIAAAGIIYNSLIGLADKGESITSWAPLFAALVSILLKEGLFHITIRVARRFKNQALIANAWHQRSDAFSSVPVAVGVVFVLLGGPRWQFMDHLAAVALGIIILTVAWKIAKTSINDLTDRAPSPEVINLTTEILKTHPGVKDFHAIRARTMGAMVEMDFHILVEPELSVREGHGIASEVKFVIMNSDESIMNVIVHVEPMTDGERMKDKG